MKIRIVAPHPAPAVQFDTGLRDHLPKSVPLPQAWITQINTLGQHSALLPRPRAQPTQTETQDQRKSLEQTRSSLEFSRTRKEDLFDEYQYDEGEQLPDEYYSGHATHTYEAPPSQTLQEAQSGASDLLCYPNSVHALDRSACLSSLLRSVEFQLFSDSPHPAVSPSSSHSGNSDYFTSLNYTGCVVRISLFDDGESSSPSPAHCSPALVLSLPRECAEMLTNVIKDVTESGRCDAEVNRRKERARGRAPAGNVPSEHEATGKRGRSRQRGRARTRSVSESRIARTECQPENVYEEGGEEARGEAGNDMETGTRSKGKKGWHRRARSLSVVGMGLVSFFG